MLPDAEELAKGWVQADASLTALLGARVATRLPRGLTVKDFPFLRIIRVGGGRENGEAELDRALMQFDAYGSKGTGKPDFTEASLVARTLVAQAEAFRGPLAVAEVGYVYGFTQFAGPRRVSDVAAGKEISRARYQVDLLMTFRATG